jgi:serine/threonine-protein kinase
MSLNSGTRLGVYEVVGPIGAGGMGEVYRGRDTKLGRDVAIKVLPEAFAREADRLARFEREARTLASLNHPNIAAIYGTEDIDGATALILELVEGPTLADRIAQAPLPLEDALQIANQIALALESAHEQNIIHRDLKPANVKVRPDGTVKVLDFGLAKALDIEVPDSNLSVSPTMSLTGVATRLGMVIGTAAYMAPEQAKGRRVDQRADVWAFGVVMYEMLTGRKPFSGEDISDTLVSVLRDEPDWSALPKEVPSSVRQALRVCFQKDPKRRVRDIAAIRLAMEGAFEIPGAPAATLAAPMPTRRFSWATAAAIVAALGVGAAAALGAARWLRTGPAARMTHFVVTTPAEGAVAIPPGLSGIAISPDGSRIAYRSIQRGMSDGPLSGIVYLREVGHTEVTPIRGTEGMTGSFFFSPDGEWVGFAANSGSVLKRVSVHGGPAQEICKLDGAWRGGVWGDDGMIVFSTTNSKGLRRVPASGGEPQVLTKIDPANGETDHVLPVVLPHGGVVFTAWNASVDRSRIVALAPSGRIVELIRGGSSPQVSSTGHLLYYADGAVRAVRFDSSRLEVSGNAVPVIEGVAAGTAGAANYAVASDGTVAYIAGDSGAFLGQRTLVWVDRQGRQEDIKIAPRAFTYARLSPDGTRVALDARDQQNDIWIFDLSRETLTRLTTDPGLNRGPVWSPDSTRVAFTAERDGLESIYWQKADGSGQLDRLSVGSSIQGPASFSPDGKRLVFITPLSAPYDLGFLDLEGERREHMLFTTKFNETNGALDPRSGRWLAYESNESGQAEVYLAPFPDVTASKKQVSTQGGTRPVWSKDGRELFYYVEPGTIMSVPVTLEPTLTLGKPTVVVKGSYAVAVNNGPHYDVSPDGKRFLLLKDAASTVGERRAPELHVIEHFDQQLKQVK